MSKNAWQNIGLAVLTVIVLAGAVWTVVRPYPGESWHPPPRPAATRSQQPQRSTQQTAAFVGDSYVAGTGATRPAKRWSSQVARRMGWQEVNFGQDRTGYVNPGDERTNVTETLAEFVAKADLSGAPEEVWEIARRAVVDTVGVTIAARRDPGFQALLQTIRRTHHRCRRTAWSRTPTAEQSFGWPAPCNSWHSASAAPVRSDVVLADVDACSDRAVDLEAQCVGLHRVPSAAALCLGHGEHGRHQNHAGVTVDLVGHVVEVEGVAGGAVQQRGTAHDSTSGPVWWLASQAPGLGDDVSAVRTVADVADGLTHEVLPGLVDASGSLSPADLQPHNGRINLEAIERVAPKVVQADKQLSGRVEQVQAIDTSGLIAPLAGPVGGLQDDMTQVGSITDAAAKAVRLLPPMLGANGERHYLLLFQNNAEVRATGGIPGAFAVVSANDGRISLGRQGTAADLGQFGKPVLPLTHDEVALFDPHLGELGQDITFTPDFPRTAAIARAMWERTSGQAVDGVMSTDPVGLSYLLRGTGPVAVPGGRQIDSDNAVKVLLNDIYMNVGSQERQNTFFALAAQHVFDALTSGQGDPKAVLEGVNQVAQEDRLLLWSAHKDEQSLLSGTAVSGELPDAATSHPAVGVYFNDGTGAKMDYYLDYDVDVQSLSCDADGRQQMRATVTMQSSAPKDAASLPESVIGPGFGAPSGVTRTNVMVYAPMGGKVQSAKFNGQQLGFASLEHDGRPVAATTVDTGPGEQQKLTFDFTSGAGQTGTADVQVTPGAQPNDDDTQVGASSCG